MILIIGLDDSPSCEGERSKYDQSVGEDIVRTSIVRDESRTIDKLVPIQERFEDNNGSRLNN